MKKINQAMLLTLISLSMNAMAASGSSSMEGSATINATCTVSSTDINFGTINPNQTGHATGNAVISATCTNETAYTINVGTGNNNSYAPRAMSGSLSGNNDKLEYNIYSDGGHSTIVGDGTSNTYQIQGSSVGGTQTYTIYGQLSLNQFVTPDNYTDNITLTLNY
jgi:spore coat protein U-like protein